MAGEREGAELVQIFETRYNQAFVASPPPIIAVAEDPTDNKFISCAAAAGAKYIVSGDRHLLDLETFRDIRIMPPTEFLKLRIFTRRRGGAQGRPGFRSV